jgi:hypothetical protein
MGIFGGGGGFWSEIGLKTDLDEVRHTDIIRFRV